VYIDVRLTQSEHQIVDPHLAHLPQRPAPHGTIVRPPSLRPPHLVQVLPGLTVKAPRREKALTNIIVPAEQEPNRTCVWATQNDPRSE
jgi:hypothetical protein